MPQPVQKWQDDTVMPFGEHQGKCLREIPDDYLFWLWDQIWLKSKFPGLYLYVKAFVEVVRKERARR
jgi:uncharacterized protein (DUF3820 family)